MKKIEKSGAYAPLFQEALKTEPFWMLVACRLVNRTTWKKAEPVLAALRETWPEPRLLAVADVYDVGDTVQTLGFRQGRAASLIDLASAWDRERPKTAEDVLVLPGCGTYASDSWAIFVEGRTDVDPVDARLREYLARTDMFTPPLTGGIDASPADPGGTPVIGESDDMGRPTKALVKARRAADAADARLDTKPRLSAAPNGTKRTLSPIERAVDAAVAAPPRLSTKAEKRGEAPKLPAPPPAVEKRRGRGPSESGTIAAMTRALIAAGKMNDEKILAEVRAAFPDKTVANNAVKHYRKSIELRHTPPRGS